MAPPLPVLKAFLNMIFFSVTSLTRLIVKIFERLLPSIVWPLPSIVMGLPITIPHDGLKVSTDSL